MSRIITIAVCGAGAADEILATQAKAIGHAIGSQGARLVCGGLGGVMASACFGAKNAGGQTIGILPGTHTAQANKWVDIPVATGLAEGRNLLIIYNADGVVALRGGAGTLSEIALALKIGKPVVDLGDWGFDGMIQPEGNTEKIVANLIRVVREQVDHQ